MDSLHGDITQPKTTDEFVRALYNRQTIVISEQKSIKDDVRDQLDEIRALHENIIPAMCTRITKLETTSDTMKWVLGAVTGIFATAISVLEWLNRTR